MLEFVYPWVFLALPLPLIVNRLLPAYRRRKPALSVPFFRRIVELSGVTPTVGAVVSNRIFYRLILMIIIWCCIVSAIARPQLVSDPITQEKSARDLMVAVDLSSSMEATDFVDEQGSNVDRLAAVKSVLTEFIARRPHDRLGLIVFGDAAFLQVPFTQDHATWMTLLDETEIAMAGTSTALGDAIGLALKHFQNNESKNRVLIILTDGNDTGSSVPPIDAAKVAAHYGVTIYPIAIGNPQTLGEEALDIETLERVAAISQGVFYQATDRAQLKDIYQRIAELEPQKFSTQSYRPRTNLHHLLMVIPTILILCFLLLSTFEKRTNRLQSSDD